MPGLRRRSVRRITVFFALLLLGALVTAVIGWPSLRSRKLAGATVTQGIFVDGHGIWRAQLGHRAGFWRYEWRALQVVPNELSENGKRKAVDFYAKAASQNSPLAVPQGTRPMSHSPWWSDHHRAAQERMTGATISGVEEAYGFPFPVTRVAIALQAVPGAYATKAIGSTLTMSVPVMRERLAPPHFLWAGVIADLLSWSATFFAVAAIFRGSRRWAARRRMLRRGWCPRCSYDLLGEFTSGCPECGWNKPRADTPAASPP